MIGFNKVVNGGYMNMFKGGTKNAIIHLYTSTIL